MLAKKSMRVMINIKMIKVSQVVTKHFTKAKRGRRVLVYVEKTVIQIDLQYFIKLKKFIFFFIIKDKESRSKARISISKTNRSIIRGLV